MWVHKRLCLIFINYNKDVIIMERLSMFPKVKLSHLPTPLEEAPAFAKAIGLKTLYIKRDDATGLALGGNKVRKLEYLLGKAVKEGKDTIITTGGPQSNHARMTAAAARKLGLEPILVLKKRGVWQDKGNMLLDRILGAEIHLIDTDNYSDVYSYIDGLMEDLKTKGRNPSMIPVGGSTPLGSLGYVECAREIFLQSKDIGFIPDNIVCSSGSGGTQGGLLLGTKHLGYDTKVIGVMVSPEKDFDKVIFEIVKGAADLLGIANPVDFNDIVLEDYVGPGYGIPSKEGKRAINLLGQTEGILVDPVYTGKALGGLIDLVENGKITSDSKIIFVHTGGAPALFAMEPGDIWEGRK